MLVKNLERMFKLQGTKLIKNFNSFFLHAKTPFNSVPKVGKLEASMVIILRNMPW